MKDKDRDRDMEYIEDVSELKLNIDKLEFESIESVNNVEFSGKVYDINVNEMHNYQTEIGFAHNGGGSF